jgi:hypothetical protein
MQCYRFIQITLICVISLNGVANADQAAEVDKIVHMQECIPNEDGAALSTTGNMFIFFADYERKINIPLFNGRELYSDGFEMLVLNFNFDEDSPTDRLMFGVNDIFFDGPAQVSSAVDGLIEHNDLISRIVVNQRTQQLEIWRSQDVKPTSYTCSEKFDRAELEHNFAYFYEYLSDASEALAVTADALELDDEVPSRNVSMCYDYSVMPKMEAFSAAACLGYVFGSFRPGALVPEQLDFARNILSQAFEVAEESVCSGRNIIVGLPGQTSQFEQGFVIGRSNASQVAVGSMSRAELQERHDACESVFIYYNQLIQKRLQNN